MKKWRLILFYMISSLAIVFGGMMAMINEGLYRDIGLCMVTFFSAMILLEYSKIKY